NGRGLSTLSLAVKGSSIFLGTEWGGIFRSDDNGVNWTRINSGLRITSRTNDLVVSGEDVYALNSIFIHKLNPDGQGWTPLNPNPISATRLAVSGSNLYLTSGTNLLRSTDGGINFTPANVGVALDTTFSVAARDGNIYLGAIANATGRVFISANNGDSFTASKSTLVANGFAFGKDILYAYSSTSGVFYSTNKGVNWTPVNAGLATRAIGALAVQGETLLAGTNGFGVFAATNPHLQPATLANTSAASFIPNGELAPESIATAFGMALAPVSQSAAAVPLPSTIAGTRITVRDSAGTERIAPLFFVSPMQVNYQVPPGTVEGNATVIATAGD